MSYIVCISANVYALPDNAFDKTPHRLRSLWSAGRRLRRWVAIACNKPRSLDNGLTIDLRIANYTSALMNHSVCIRIIFDSNRLGGYVCCDLERQAHSRCLFCLLILTRFHFFRKHTFLHEYFLRGFLLLFLARAPWDYTIAIGVSGAYIDRFPTMGE